MVTDTLAPVLSEDGVGTISTLNDRKVLVEGLTFETLKVETYLTTLPICYRIGLKQGIASKTTINLFMTGDANLMTTSGWVPVRDMIHSMATGRPKMVGAMLKVLNFRCLACGKFYLPSRPMQTTCSKGCMYAARQSNIITFKPLNKSSVPDNIREDWTELNVINEIIIPVGIEAARVVSLDGHSGLYINNLLCSSDSLLNRV